MKPKDVLAQVTKDFTSNSEFSLAFDEFCLAFEILVRRFGFQYIEKTHALKEAVFRCLAYGYSR